MSTYEEFFLNSKISVVQLECLEIYHPNFSKRYYVVRNHTLGVTVKHENGIYRKYDYYPLAIERDGDYDDLDQGYKITLGDLGEMVPNEIDNVRVANGFATKPTLIYRAYRSDDLDNILLGPSVLQIKNFAMTDEGSAFNAVAPYLNINATGELYTLDRFDALRGTM